MLGFIEYLQNESNQSVNQTVGKLRGECNKCSSVFEYDTEQAYSEGKVCDEMIDGVLCEGSIELIK